eukprot:TRINITY_DN23394_c0_g1_i1.p1 TRINITY_DN23394_c0_g1~~TRINITY_DN23394_c0_g1_i1.p1  ORF type:complete len:560 (+),score=152.20 TRINITY_DN23394_c0_g1_i1:76-1680(+)
MRRPLRLGAWAAAAACGVLPPARTRADLPPLPLAELEKELAATRSTLGFKADIPEPAYLAWGYDARHPRIRERWQLIAREVRERLAARGKERVAHEGDASWWQRYSAPLSVAEWGSGHGGIALSIAHAFPETVVFSIEGEVEGPPLGEHMQWARLPDTLGGMVAHQRHAAAVGGLNNTRICRAKLGQYTFDYDKLPAGFHPEIHVEVQIALQFFHWLRQELNSVHSFRRMFHSLCTRARVTLVDLPPPGTSVPDTAAWLAADGGDILAAARGALEHDKDMEVSVVEPQWSGNPFVLLRVVNKGGRFVPPERLWADLSRLLECDRGTHDGRGAPEPTARWIQHAHDIKLTTGDVYHLAKNQLNVWEEMPGEGGKVWYYCAADSASRWDPPEGAHWLYLPSQRRMVYRGPEMDRPAEEPRLVSGRPEYASEAAAKPNGVYYWDESTGKTQWERPAALGVVSSQPDRRLYWQDPVTGKSTWARPQEYDWEEVPAPLGAAAAGRFYFRNRQTGETTWDRPAVLRWREVPAQGQKSGEL